MLADIGLRGGTRVSGEVVDVDACAATADIVVGARKFISCEGCVQSVAVQNHQRCMCTANEPRLAAIVFRPLFAVISQRM